MSRGMKPILEISHPVDADYSTKEGYAFKFDGSGNATVCTALGENMECGVLLNGPDAAGKNGLFGKFGQYPVWAGGSFAKGDYLAVSAAGKFVKATYGDICVAQADEAGSDGGLYTATILPIPFPLGLGDPIITIGDETGGTTIKVTIQFVDQNGANVDKPVNAKISLHDDAAGQTVGTAHSTSPAIAASGLLEVIVTDLSFWLTTEANGLADINLVDDGAQTIYLKIVMPDGRQVMSGAITHAA